MKKTVLNIFILIGLLASLSACMDPDTPQDVTRSFWQAVADNETDDAVKYSTLTDPKYYDAFSKSWQGYQLSIGRIVVEQNQANIVSDLNSPANSGLPDRNLTTYLVMQDGEWKVDYVRTKEMLDGGAIGGLFNKLGKLGEELSTSFQTSVGQMGDDVDDMLIELDQLSRSFSEKATKSLELHADRLRQHIKELEDSINRALIEERERLTEQDKATLQVMAKELNEDRKQLANHSMEAIMQSSQHVVEAQLKLETSSSKALNKYKEEWKMLSQQFEDDLRKMMDELSARG